MVVAARLESKVVIRHMSWQRWTEVTEDSDLLPNHISSLGRMVIMGHSSSQKQHL